MAPPSNLQERLHLAGARPARIWVNFLAAAALFFGLALPGSVATADDAAPPKSPAPDQRELWVPTGDLATVLAQYPKAVLLSRAEYDALLRDASATKSKEPKAPRQAILTAARYTARPVGDGVLVDGELTVTSLVEGWAQLPLQFNGVFLSSAEVDDQSALTPASAEAGSSASSLLIFGAGAHRLHIAFSVAINRTGSSNAISFLAPHGGRSTILIQLPRGAVIDCNHPVHTIAKPDFLEAEIALAAEPTRTDLRWSEPASGFLPPSATVAISGTVSADQLRIDTQFSLLAVGAELPPVLDFDLRSGLLTLSGPDVANWTTDQRGLHVTLQPGHRSQTSLNLTSAQPALNGADRASIRPVIPILHGGGPVEGTFEFIGGPEAAIREVRTSAVRLQLNGTAGAELYQFSGAAPVELVVERLKPRFSADLDTLADFQSDSITIERTVTLHPEEGGLFRLDLTMPEGEEIVSIRSGNKEPDWRREGRRVSIRFNQQAFPPLKICTRLDPPGWNALTADGLTIPLHDLHLDGAERVSGYIALRAASDFRLEAQPGDSLERRDGRTTPVQGAYAWFRRDDFALNVKVMRRPADITAQLRGYALPLAGVLDLHAEIAWQFLHAGVRSVQVRVPEADANQFHFDGPQIAERTLTGDIWTITFQKELTGDYTMAVAAQVELNRLPDHPSQFKIALPSIDPLSAQHSSGVWAVESNTDTEVTVEAAGLNELDAQLAPSLAGYQPRHHVIGVYPWIGHQYNIQLSGVRHPSGHTLDTIVDEVSLTSVVSPEVVRTQAALLVRSVGEQFLELTLPDSAHLLSLTRDDEPLKPVQGEPGRLRVQLPANADPKTQAHIGILYEMSFPAWAGAGSAEIAALRLPPDVPVLKSRWEVYLPDGYHYDRLKTNLTEVSSNDEPPLLLTLWRGLQSLWVQGRSSSEPRAPHGFSSGAEPTQPMATPFPTTTLIAGNSVVAPTTTWPTGKEWDRPVRKFKGAPPRDGSKTSGSDVDRTAYKLDHIIIPKIELREATVAESINFLREKAEMLDTTEIDPARRGLNIVMDAAAENSEQRISVMLGNVPLGVALKYITDLANLKYKVTPTGVTIEPLATPSDTLITKEWAFPQSELGNRKAEDYLKSNGVTFPMGASAVYLPQTGRLVVKNTQENIDLVEGLLPTGIEPTDLNAPLLAKSFKVFPGSFSAPSADPSHPEAVNSVDPKEYFIAAGVTFPAGAIVVYDAKQQKLIAKNTERNLQLIETLLEPAGSADRTVAFVSDAAGLLPLKLDLPASGQPYAFTGLTAPDHLTVHFTSQAARARRLWLWLIGGVFASLCCGGARPWRRTFWLVVFGAALALFAPAAFTTVCNAFLTGWLASLILRRLLAWFLWLPTARKEALA